MAHRRPPIPPPAHLSEGARRYLEAAMAARGDGDDRPSPARDDAAAWTDLIRSGDDALRAELEPRLPGEDILQRTRFSSGDVPVHVLTPAALRDVDDPPIFLEVHGGALIHNGGDLAWMTVVDHAVGRPGITWVPDYRMPPAAPYPAAVDDVVEVYRALLEQRRPERIIVTGGSAGGNIAAAGMLRARDEGLPMPAAVILLTPEVDLTESGDTHRTNLGLDVAGSMMDANLLYAGGLPLDDPRVSPLFADFAGFPPTFLSAGTRDVFLSNTVRLHARLLAAGVEAELHVFEAMPHWSFGGGTPEDAAFIERVHDFERRRLG